MCSILQMYLDNVVLGRVSAKLLREISMTFSWVFQDILFIFPWFFSHGILTYNTKYMIENDFQGVWWCWKSPDIPGRVLVGSRRQNTKILGLKWDQKNTQDASVLHTCLWQNSRCPETYEKGKFTWYMFIVLGQLKQ